jgi:FixJ family two-component response regulator
MMSNSCFVIFLVDDDPGVLKALTRMLSTQGYEVRAFSSPAEFLAQHDRSVPGCAIFDLSMPGLDGIELQAALKADGVERPVIFITGVGDIPVTVQAMRAGAVDFLTKPVKSQQLLAAIALAAEKEEHARHHRNELASVNDQISRLTPREREVLTHVIAGRLNKQIAADLGTVEKTIKLHRGRVMHKMGVRSVADLVRITERAGIRPLECDVGPRSISTVAPHLD